LLIGNPFESKLFIKNFLSFYDSQNNINNLYVFGYEKKDINMTNICNSFYTSYKNNDTYYSKIENFERNVGFFFNKETELSKVIIIRLKKISDLNKSYINFIAQAGPFINATVIFTVDMLDNISSSLKRFSRNFINYTFINYNEHSITKIRQFTKILDFPIYDSPVYKMLISNDNEYIVKCSTVNFGNVDNYLISVDIMKLNDLNEYDVL